jgi:hypothetical protein
MSEEYRKIHITIDEKNYQLIRKIAYESDATKSAVINFLIEEGLARRDEGVPATESTKPPEQAPPPLATAWSVTTLRKS